MPSSPSRPSATAGRDVRQLAHHRLLEPALHVVLFQPEIPANTGNIARLCGAAELRLHLIHPLGFRLDDRHLKRAGLDCWSAVDLVEHISPESFLQTLAATKGRLFAFSRHTPRPYTAATVRHGDYLMFGSETGGLPANLRRALPCFAIPIWGNVRSLNLSTSVGIVAYHYLHAMGKF